MNKPVYVFSGFLDSGKTLAIKNTLMNPNFNEGESSLIICFEQGDVIYDDKFLKLTNTKVLYMDSINELTIDKQKQIDKEYNAERIFLELNGMEDDNIIYDVGFIKNWELAQTLTTIDASTFNMYLTNMRQFMYNHVVNAECIILNRSDDADKRYLRNNLKSINQFCEIIYENKDGSVSNKIEEELFDLSKDLFVEDSDYGLWYMDCIDNPDRYDKKTVTLKMKYVDNIEEYSNVVVMGRRAMVCCANDITDIAISCAGVDKDKIKKDQYYYLTGRLHSVKAQDGSKTCVLYVTEIKDAEAPKEELVTFN